MGTLYAICCVMVAAAFAAIYRASRHGSQFPEQTDTDPEPTLERPAITAGHQPLAIEPRRTP